jgi:hypothetical protein
MSYPPDTPSDSVTERTPLLQDQSSTVTATEESYCRDSENGAAEHGQGSTGDAELPIKPDGYASLKYILPPISVGVGLVLTIIDDLQNAWSNVCLIVDFVR